MKQTTIPVSSITNAMRGKELLERHGVSVYIQRSFHMDDQNGCGYQLVVNGDGKRAVDMLRSAGFRLKDGGKEQ